MADSPAQDKLVRGEGRSDAFESSSLQVSLRICSSTYWSAPRRGNRGSAGGRSEAREIIGRAVDYLANAKQFRASAEIWEDLEVESGEMAQFSKVVEIQLRRPDRLRLDVSTSVPKRSFYYDGASLTVLDRATGTSHPPRRPPQSTRHWRPPKRSSGSRFPSRISC